MEGHTLDLFKVCDLHFEKPDPENFPAFGLAYDVMKAGGSLPTVYNAANEYAVAQFLDGQIGFTDIGDMIQRAVDSHTNIENPTLEEILEIEESTYRMFR